MLATWIRDVYMIEDSASMRAAIDAIASPLNHGGFASNGVYVFFDPESHDILYVGLARDLSERFGQHHGLVAMDPKGCKLDQIRYWWTSHATLGYAVCVQSPFSQVSVGRQRGTSSAAFYDEETDSFWDYPDEGLRDIADVEGQLIAAYKERHRHLPPWNKIGGSLGLNNQPTANTYTLLELASGRIDCLSLSRRTIRELADDPWALYVEETMHLGRMAAIEDTFGIGIDSPTIIDSLQRRANMPEYAETGLIEAWNHLCEVNYFMEAPPPPANEATPGRLKRRTE